MVYDIAAGDFNGDGALDLAATFRKDYTPQFGVLLGDGSGGLSDPICFTVDSSPMAIAVGDFNGDGRCDLAVRRFKHVDTNEPGRSITPICAYVYPLLAFRHCKPARSEPDSSSRVAAPEIQTPSMATAASWSEASAFSRTHYRLIQVMMARA